MHRARVIVTLALVLIAQAVALAGCSTEPSGFPTPAPRPTGASPSAPTGTGAATEPTPGPDQSGAPGLPSQSESEFGTVWDAVPDGFPEPRGAEPVEAEDGPVSAASLVPAPATGLRSLAELYRSAFDDKALGGSTDGPLEDGTVVVWASNGYGCDIYVRLAPRGGDVLVSVFFGGGCQFSWRAD